MIHNIILKITCIIYVLIWYLPTVIKFWKNYNNTLILYALGLKGYIIIALYCANIVQCRFLKFSVKNYTYWIAFIIILISPSCLCISDAGCQNLFPTHRRRSYQYYKNSNVIDNNSLQTIDDLITMNNCRYVMVIS